MENINENVLEEVNGGSVSPTGLYVGPCTYYTVKKGDTISSIALNFKCTEDDIRNLNKLPKGKSIRVGQKLLVPNKTTTV